MSIKNEKRITLLILSALSMALPAYSFANDQPLVAEMKVFQIDVVPLIRPLNLVL